MPEPLRVARRRAPPAERREQILTAALRCFAEHGYHTATMDHLSREAGLSKGRPLTSSIACSGSNSD